MAGQMHDVVIFGCSIAQYRYRRSRTLSHSNWMCFWCQCSSQSAHARTIGNSFLYAMIRLCCVAFYEPVNHSPSISQEQNKGRNFALFSYWSCTYTLMSFVWTRLDLWLLFRFVLIVFMGGGLCFFCASNRTDHIFFFFASFSIWY